MSELRRRMMMQSDGAIIFVDEYDLSENARKVLMFYLPVIGDNYEIILQNLSNFTLNF